MKHVLRIGRRIGIAIAGGAVIIAGIILAMPLVPGPGVALILLGLGILSVEFEWPRVWLARIKEKGLKLKDFILRKKSRSGDEQAPADEQKSADDK
jgi:hypothetical protein